MGNSVCCAERKLPFPKGTPREHDDILTTLESTIEDIGNFLPSRTDVLDPEVHARVLETRNLQDVPERLERLTIRLPRKISNTNEYEMVLDALNCNQALVTLHLDISNNWLSKNQLIKLLNAIESLDNLENLELSIEMNQISDEVGSSLAHMIRSFQYLKKLILKIDPDSLTDESSTEILNAVYHRSHPIKQLSLSGIC